MLGVDHFLHPNIYRTIYYRTIKQKDHGAGLNARRHTIFKKQRLSRLLKAHTQQFRKAGE